MYTVEKLKAMSLEQRAQIYKNCLRKGGPEAEAIIQMLKATGMPYQKDSSLAHGDAAAYDRGRRACNRQYYPGHPGYDY